ncbi:uncharacterized protein LOC110974306 [Acanthaster planci]|uniref:Uncharacterized protein LOC110974306 n=1 Tax=Acanthaster planci TaxID=133434 RepID=A0A8B7XNB0_ACAPL|nr:uncharacterized protein LOC110974306 [Acanthaster planci]
MVTSSLDRKSVLSVCLLLFLQHPRLSDAACGNSTLTDCKNGGECNEDGTCECPHGYSGPVCEHTVVSKAILVLVCIMPAITWTIVCCYGCRSYRAKIKRQRRRASARANRQRATSDEDDIVPVDDDPPGYDQAVHENPVAICGLDENPDWTFQTGVNYLELPPHYEDLINAIKSGKDMPTPVIIEMEPTNTVESSRTVGELEIEERGRGRGSQDTTHDEPSSSTTQSGINQESGCNSRIAREDSSSVLCRSHPGDEPSSLGTFSETATEEKVLSAPPNQRESGDEDPTALSQADSGGAPGQRDMRDQ